jgi:hypothetical protein
MGKLKITADGRETLIYKDHTETVLGNNDRMTAGNDAYATAGVREDVVLGFLLTALLGGNLEVAVGRTFLDGTLTRLSGRKDDLAAVASKVTQVNTRIVGVEEAIAETTSRATESEDEVSFAKTLIRESRQVVRNQYSFLGNIKLETLQTQINEIAAHAATVASSVSVVADALSMCDTAAIVTETSTALNELTTM